MPVEERFGIGPNIVIGVQARPVENVTDLFLLGVRVAKTNIEEERHITVDFQLDGELYELELVFRDETLSGRDFLGRVKKKQNEDQQATG
jgi:hypothetical protein